MSKVQPSRPGAQRRPSGPSVQVQSKGPSAEEINALPEFIEDGENINLDPALASDGGFGAGEGTTASIVAARFGKFNYPNRPDIASEIRLFVSFQQAGFDRPREESFRYADFGKFAVSKDSNLVKLRPSAIKANKDGSTYKPTLYKFNQGVLFVQSLKDAGFSVEKFNKEGAKALVGLTVHVRKRRVDGQGDNAKPALLVDYIGTGVPVNPNSASVGNQAPAHANQGNAVQDTQVQAPANSGTSQVTGNSDVEALAEAALLDILGGAPENTIARSAIPMTLVRIDKWKQHDQRGAILKLLREDSFVNKENAAWRVDAKANTISL